MIGAVPRIVLSLALTIGGSATACHGDVPPLTPTPLTPEVTRKAPRPQRIEPTRHKPRKVRVSEAAERSHDVPVDAGVSDVIDLPPVPDSGIELVLDAGQPLK